MNIWTPGILWSLEIFGFIRKGSIWGLAAFIGLRKGIERSPTHNCEQFVSCLLVCNAPVIQPSWFLYKKNKWWKNRWQFFSKCILEVTNYISYCHLTNPLGFLIFLERPCTISTLNIPGQEEEDLTNIWTRNGNWITNQAISMIEYQTIRVLLMWVG